MNSTLNNDNSQDATTAVNSIETTQRSRMIAPDVLRLIACLFVLSIHFLLNNKFYEEPIDGFEMTVMLVMRVIFSTCVPLFIIITGYLMSSKPLSKKHYAKGMKIVWIYLLSTLAIVLYRMVIKHEIKLSDAFWGTLQFKAAPYAWYVEMYLGLFLIIPFLNILYKNLPSKRWKQAMILCAFALTSLPKIINVYNFVIAGWWSDPLSAANFQMLIPAWWLGGYPIVYYFIGAYLREYGLGIKKGVQRGLLVFFIAATTFYYIWRSSGQQFSWGAWTDWEFPLTMINATLLASLMLGKEYRRMPQAVAKAVGYVSGLTLEIFLVSYIFDKLYYPILNDAIPNVSDRLWSYFIMVPAVFLSSLILAAVIDLIYRSGYWCYKKIRDRLRQRKHAESIE